MTRAKDLERRGLAPSSIRRKLAAVASLFDHLCEANAVSHNPVHGVKRPKADNNEGKTRDRAKPEATADGGSTPTKGVLQTLTGSPGPTLLNASLPTVPDPQRESTSA